MPSWEPCSLKCQPGILDVCDAESRGHDLIIDGGELEYSGVKGEKKSWQRTRRFVEEEFSTLFAGVASVPDPPLTAVVLIEFILTFD